jgi:hypothetical protein
MRRWLEDAHSRRGLGASSPSKRAREEGMPFALRNVGASCYALLFKEEHIGAVFSSDDDHPEPWVAVIHDGWAGAKAQLPVPFQSKIHRFETLQDLKGWLRSAPRPAAPAGAG